MKSDWDTLAEEFKDSKRVVIADVDCTAAGEPICSRFKVEGFPTLKSFSPLDIEGEDYEGARELDDLREHAKSLGPGCSPTTKDDCTAEELISLDELVAQPPEALEAEISELKGKVAAASAAHVELVKRLRAQFEQSDDGLNELKRASAARLRLLRGAYGGDYPRCDDDPFFADKDGEGCAAYGVKPAFSCGHEGYEGSCKSCCATCSGMPKCELLAAKAPEAEGAPKDEV